MNKKVIEIPPTGDIVYSSIEGSPLHVANKVLGPVDIATLGLFNVATGRLGGDVMVLACGEYSRLNNESYNARAHALYGRSELCGRVLIWQDNHNELNLEELLVTLKGLTDD